MSSATSHLSAEARASLPQHVAVIMDGNGRWAKQHGLPRVEGHRVGAESARTIIRTAGELGIKYLTLYAFSAENWNRPKDEVDALMKYLVHYLKSETPELNKSNVRLEVIGQIYRLPENVQEHLRKSIATLSKNNGLTLVMALSYGSRIEIVEAVRAIAEKVKSGKLESADITEKIISDHLWTRGIPDPDLLIRTSGEMRVSNFLLWQISYAELVITPTLWPDFRKPQFFAALPPRFTNPHERRDACEQFSFVANFLRGTRHHADALAGFPQAAIFRRAGGICTKASPVWRRLIRSKESSTSSARARPKPECVRCRPCGWGR